LGKRNYDQVTPASVRKTIISPPLVGRAEAFARAQIVKALHKYNGNNAMAAQALGISLATLYQLMKKYGL